MVPSSFYVYMPVPGGEGATEGETSSDSQKRRTEPCRVLWFCCCFSTQRCPTALLGFSVLRSCLDLLLLLLFLLFRDIA